MVTAGLGMGLEAGLLSVAGKLSWLLFSTGQKHVRSTCWLAAQSVPFSLPEVPVFCPGGNKRQAAQNNKPGETEWGPARVTGGRAKGKRIPEVETGWRAICRLNVQGEHRAGLLLGLDDSRTRKARRSGC